MSKFNKIFLFVLSFIVVLIGSLYYFSFHFSKKSVFIDNKIVEVDASASDNVYGWVWGPNFGWINLNCLNDYDGDGKISLPSENRCSISSYGLNIGSSGVFDDDSYAWSNWLGWVDFAPASSVATDPLGNPTQDATLNSDGTISGWARVVAQQWPTLNCHSWIRLRGDEMPQADFDSFTWNATSQTYQGTFPVCTGCNYYKRYCSGGDNDGLACSSDADCPNGSCEYSVVDSTTSGASFLCDICYSDKRASNNMGTGKLCVKISDDERCSGCTDNSASGDPNTCTDCPRCYEYGVAVDYSKNRLTGWAWGVLHNEDGGSCPGSTVKWLLGTGWLAFHADTNGIFAPWLETEKGNIYGISSIGSSTTFRPPSGKYNATYAIHAGGTITNFYTNQGDLWKKEYYENLDYPDTANNYSNLLGRIDFPGLQAGLYGPVEEITSASDIDSVLGGKVYLRNGDLTINSALTFNNGDTTTPSGAGTIIVKGNLYINANITYSSTTVSKIKYLPSVAFIVLGDVVVDPSVTEINGAYIVLGDGDPDSCPALSSASNGCGRFSTGSTNTAPLLVNGLVIAKQFNLERLYSSLTSGSEKFVYDGRILANPPPGLEDIEEALPEWREVAP